MLLSPIIDINLKLFLITSVFKKTTLELKKTAQE